MPMVKATPGVSTISAPMMALLGLSDGYTSRRTSSTSSEPPSAAEISVNRRLIRCLANSCWQTVSTSPAAKAAAISAGPPPNR